MANGQMLQGSAQVNNITGYSTADYLPSSQGYRATRGLAAQQYLAQPGTLDLSRRQMIDMDAENSPVVDPRGYGSEYSARDTLPSGHQMVYPTIYDGQLHDRREAFQHALDTGQHMGIFHPFTPEEAINEYEQKLHSRPQFLNNGQRLTGDKWAKLRSRRNGSSN